EQPWLRVTTPSVSGPQQAVISFEIDTISLPPGLHEGTVRVVANAGQTLTLKVHVEVERPYQSPTSQLLRPVFVGVLLGLLLRLLLPVPADLFARLIMGATRASLGEAGSLESWATWPAAEDGFVRFFVLGSCWLGPLVGFLLMRQRSERVGDQVCGLVAGFAAGLALCATLACILPALDTPPRLLLALLNSGDGSPKWWLWTPVWMLLVTVWWGILGGVMAAILQCLGSRGLQVLGRMAAPLVWMLEKVGMKGAAGFFVFS